MQTQDEENVTSTINEQAAAEQVIEDMTQDAPANETKEEQMVPLAAHTKLRKRAQEAEQEAQWLRQQLNSQRTITPPPEEDTSRYESATKAELGQSQNETVRLVEEKLWIKANPDKYEKVNELLPDFLKQRPNLTHAINSASNRYEEAYTLMEALTPKQQQKIKPAVVKKEVKEAPGAPNGIPKSAAMNEAVDVMNMSDKEFSEWRQSQKKRR